MHSPIINESTAGCSCRRWNGPIKQPNETRGEYTNRAYLAHAYHAGNANVRPIQPGLFEQQQSLFEGTL